MFQSCPGLGVILLLDDDKRGQRGILGLDQGASTSQSSSSLDTSPHGTAGRASATPGRGTSGRNICGATGSDGGAGARGATRAFFPDSSSDVSVDLNVVDYVLKKPFSDESFRLLLEAVEADHLQVRA